MVRKINQNLHNLRTHFDENGFSNLLVLQTTSLSRNLNSYLFPDKLNSKDRDSLLSLLTTTLTTVANNKECKESFTIKYGYDIKQNERYLYQTYGILDEEIEEREDFALALSEKKDLFLTLCGQDHLLIRCIDKKLNLLGSCKRCLNFERLFQRYCKFAYDNDSGYLTSSLKDAGSGIRIRVRVCLLNTARLGRIDKISSILQKEGFTLSPALSQWSGRDCLSGPFFDITNTLSLNKNIEEACKRFNDVLRYLSYIEGTNLDILSTVRMTELQNTFLRSFLVAKYSLLVLENEAFDIIGDLKTAAELNLVKNLDFPTLYSLTVKVQEPYLLSIKDAKKYKLTVSQKKDKSLMLNRLRALILQEVLKDLEFN